MCANTQLENASSDRSFFVPRINGSIDFDEQIREGLRVRIKEDIGEGQTICKIYLYFDNGFDYYIPLYFPAHMYDVRPCFILCDADFIHIMDKQRRIIFSINHRIVAPSNVEPCPPNLVEYTEKKCPVGEIESDVINEIVCKLQTKQLSQQEIMVELEKFIAELFHVLSLDRYDVRTHAEVYNYSYHIEFLNDDMTLHPGSYVPHRGIDDASYMRISPAWKVRFQPFIIPFNRIFLRILWPV